jgi:hypothetical protein
MPNDIEQAATLLPKKMIALRSMVARAKNEAFRYTIRFDLWLRPNQQPQAVTSLTPIHFAEQAGPSLRRTENGRDFVDPAQSVRMRFTARVRKRNATPREAKIVPTFSEQPTQAHHPTIKPLSNH